MLVKYPVRHRRAGKRSGENIIKKSTNDEDDSHLYLENTVRASAIPAAFQTRENANFKCDFCGKTAHTMDHCFFNPDNLYNQSPSPKSSTRDHWKGKFELEFRVLMVGRSDVKGGPVLVSQAHAVREFEPSRIQFPNFPGA